VEKDDETIRENRKVKSGDRFWNVRKDDSEVETGRHWKGLAETGEPSI
jgi:hypothetical protein